MEISVLMVNDLDKKFKRQGQRESKHMCVIFFFILNQQQKTLGKLEDR